MQIEKQNISFFQQSSQAGTSLVEIMVSAVILGIVILAIISMIQKGRELDVSSDHRRQARALIHAAFEQDEFKIANYNAISDTTTSRTDSVQLDPDESTPLTGVLSISVSAANVMTVNSTQVPYKDITMTLTWNEPEGPDTVQVMRRISNAK
ncbi:MAG: hypothetical protein HQK83_07935 [Fibrobacteria bacterium]|nr:hypothetical protein [Fibrobacteria bacterium]